MPRWASAEGLSFQSSLTWAQRTRCASDDESCRLTRTDFTELAAGVRRVDAKQMHEFVSGNRSETEANRFTTANPPVLLAMVSSVSTVDPGCHPATSAVVLMG
jgi:hypothetical protein